MPRAGCSTTLGGSRSALRPVDGPRRSRRPRARPRTAGRGGSSFRGGARDDRKNPIGPAEGRLPSLFPSRTSSAFTARMWTCWSHKARSSGRLRSPTPAAAACTRRASRRRGADTGQCCRNPQSRQNVWRRADVVLADSAHSYIWTVSAEAYGLRELPPAGEIEALFASISRRFRARWQIRCADRDSREPADSSSWSAPTAFHRGPTSLSCPTAFCTA